MRIEYLKLRNFASIYTGMKTKEIEIDFTKSKHRVTLLVGENGTGKTSILAQLQPFAMPGSVDQQNNGPSIIMPGTDGYKEIHYDFDGIKYIIKHYYRYASQKGLKSFISRDGEELNPNGNVGSFTSMIEREFKIDADFLALLRLGTNVTGFIGKPAAGRKAFIGNLLKDIDIYSQFYKKVNDDVRLIKHLLKSVASKIVKLNVYDEASEISNLEHQQNLKAERETMLSQQYTNLGRIQTTIETKLGGINVEDIQGMIQEQNAIVTRTAKQRARILQQQDALNIDATLTVERAQQQMQRVNIQIAGQKTAHDLILKQLDDVLHQLDEKINTLRLSDYSEFEVVEKLYNQLMTEYADLEKKYRNHQVLISREEALNMASTVDEIASIAATIYTYSPSSIRKVTRMLRRGENVKNFVELNLKRVALEHEHALQEAALQNYPRWKPKEGQFLMLYESTCEGGCPYRTFYEDITREVTPSDTKESKIIELEMEREHFMEYLSIEQHIAMIQLLVKAQQEVQSRAPIAVLNMSKIYDVLDDTDDMVSRLQVPVLLSIVENYQVLLDTKVRLDKVRQNKLEIQSNQGNIKELQNEILTLEMTVGERRTTLDIYKTQLQESYEQLAFSTQQLDDIQTYTTLQTTLDELQQTHSTASSEIENLQEKFKSVEALVNERASARHLIQTIEGEIAHHNDEIQKIQLRLNEFVRLEKERKQLNAQYEEINIIREALSPTKGIPLLFIQLYLKNASAKINELLQIVYNGDLQLDDFIINEKEFRIPYIKQGIRVEDVSSCSQGEKSFVALALSFTLLAQPVKDLDTITSQLYNVMLFDELDGPLDPRKKGMFLPILERKLDSIDAEQAFVISHSNVFDSYPVDVIMTSEVNLDNYKNSNIIFKAK